MAHHAHRRSGYNLIEFESEKGLQPSPEEEVGLIEDHQRDEHGAKQANDRRADRAIGDDDGDQRSENTEDDLNRIGAEQRIWLRE